MYFLVGICENPDILRILYFIQKIFDLVFLIVPIGLIVMITIDVFKNVVATDDKEASKNNKRIITRLIFAIMMFFVPIIVSTIMNILESTGVKLTYTDKNTGQQVSYKTCWDNSKDLNTINEKFQNAYDEEE